MYDELLNDRMNDTKPDVAASAVERLVMPFNGIQKCENCTRAVHEFDGDYGTIDCGWYCDLHYQFHEKRGYPKNFPFLQAPGCFIPEFFLTSFSEILPDGFCGDGDDDDIYQAACKDYLKFYYNRA